MDSALLFATVACAVFAAACWIVSVVTREHSWVDRGWSIVPVLYVAWFWWSAERPDARLGIITILVALWGGRLTYNFARKGGYAAGGEDYRWAALRERMSPARFAVFNVVFVCAFQNALLLLITLPAWVAARPGAAPPGLLDVVAILAFLVFLAGESLADEQQWRFQRDKKARRDRGEPIERNFLTTGLFRWSRHPNFFCEQGLWWSLGLFAVASGAPWLGLHWLGAALLSLLFQGSTAFTEELTRAKYPEYAEYQRSTPRLFPWRRPRAVRGS